MVTADTTYSTEDGRPLITAAQAGEIGIRPRTVYEWRRRGYLQVRGLTEDGRELYDAGELAAVKAKPRRRVKVAA